MLDSPVFAGNAQWARISPLFAPILDYIARPSSLNCKKVFLGKETADQAIVCSIACAFRSYALNVALEFFVFHMVSDPCHSVE